MNIEKLLSGLVEEKVINDIIGNIEQFEYVPIKNLGVDSLALMELVLRIEEQAGIEIDFDEFEVDSVSTLNKISHFFNQSEELK
ncbi:acyl carrier protein [Enterococcus rotai]|uniref:Carrier domain-containing protein n=2 Tax=Enterococcus TaxID=1350 RepID=R2Q6U0_9ENTE|nr:MULTISPECIES: acyl carrier protein [Enterococcus]ALS38441.1 hypothetical protein ATZ35_15180 [Enterococcus rotai]EOH92242.1 hypothetical protein UAW_03227 [Enterococcus haemoperoxidus ATCC BAA-382]EOT61927.1 hypothetical protein I583_00910 [Enterococcus haemoperoxidus ATCC BAA-382]OJG54164.1 hypothetical protein RV06_GL003117 [Enterococcus haemoperoxidus]